MLGIIIICLHGRPLLISKIVPVSNLDANYLHDQVASSQANIEQGEPQKPLFVTVTEQIRRTSESTLDFLINLDSQKMVLISSMILFIYWRTSETCGWLRRQEKSPMFSKWSSELKNGKLAVIFINYSHPPWSRYLA